MRLRRFFRFKVFLSAFVLFVLFYLPFFGFSALRKAGTGGLSSSKGYQGIISLWNVDTFEGGTYSRKALLSDFARAFEEKNKGIFVLTENYTFEEFQSLIEQGSRPDMISFGAGAGELVKDSLQRFGGKVFARGEIASGGRLRGATYGVPWCMGGYAVFSTDRLLLDAKIDREKNLLGEVFSGGYMKSGKTPRAVYSLITGSAYTLPLAALSRNSSASASGEYALEEAETQYSAYERFVSLSSHTFLLGTQRDAYRLGLKAEQGKINELITVPLSGYTDLVQYLGIFEGVGGTRLEACEAFIEYVTGDICQQKLIKLSMFSPCGVRLYTSGPLAEMEEALFRPLSVLNAFTSAQVLTEYKRLSSLAVKGDEGAKKSINGL